MENTYGVGTKNRYALFYDEEEDPLEVLKVQEQEKEAKKKTKLSEKENKAKQETSKPKSNANPRKTPKETNNTKEIKKEEIKPKTPARPAIERNDRNVKFSNETSREERNNKRNREERPHQEFNRDNNVRPEGNGEGGRGRGRGAVRGIGLTRGRGGMRGTPRGGGGGGGGGGYDNRGKREFDRQSGSDKTGIKPIDKREGGGAHNWGNHKDDINEQLNISGPEDHAEWSPEKPEDNNVQTENTENKDETTPETENDQNPPVEEEPRELTLDEYKALRGNRQKPTYNLRKAGEGEDLTQWKTMYALTKKKEGDDDDEDDENDMPLKMPEIEAPMLAKDHLPEYDASEYPQRVGRQKHILDIDILFTDARRGMRGRGGLRPGSRVPGGRSGPRGGMRTSGPGRAAAINNDSRSPAMGRGDRGPGVGADRYGERDSISQRERLPRQQQSAPKVDDEHDFPSLG